MKQLDAYTVIMMFAMVTFVCTFILIAMWQRFGQLFNGLNAIYMSYFIQASGLMLGLFAKASPHIFRFILPNFLILVSIGVFVYGISTFVDYRVKLIWYVPYYIIFLGTYTYLNFIGLSVNYLIAMVSFFALPLYVYLVYILSHRADKDHMRYAFGVKLVAILTGFLHAGRIVFAILSPRISDYFREEAQMDYVFLAFFQVLMVLMTFAVVLMIIEKKAFENSHEARRLEEVILKKEVLATTDSLTTLYNRRKIESLINDHYNDFRESGRLFSVLMVDIDHFKSVNDQFGHDVGDKVLVEFSQCLKENVRDFDQVGRWGGEEFLVILDGVGKESAIRTAERLRYSCSNMKLSAINHQNITISVGVIEASLEKSVHQMIKEADRMLYNAKAEGRNTICYEYLETVKL